jgi:hypothetical protein
MDDAEKPPYVVMCVDDRFQVINQSGRTIMSCSDRDSAEHYADLLNSAFDAGFRACRRQIAPD